MLQLCVLLFKPKTGKKGREMRARAKGIGGDLRDTEWGDFLGVKSADPVLCTQPLGQLRGRGHGPVTQQGEDRGLGLTCRVAGGPGRGGGGVSHVSVWRKGQQTRYGVRPASDKPAPGAPFGRGAGAQEQPLDWGGLQAPWRPGSQARQEGQRGRGSKGPRAEGHSQWGAGEESFCKGQQGPAEPGHPSLRTACWFPGC